MSPSTARLSNPDLAPVPPEGRRWGWASYATLWISLSACIPTYMLASSLIGGGMSGVQAILTIFLGNVIVLIPMLLNAHAGTRYGIPFPVLCRASFGTSGANAAALLRALVACGWFGIQTWIGGDAIFRILGVFAPGLASGAPLPLVGISGAQLACFLVFWTLNLAIVFRGIESIRILLNIKAPLLIALGLLLLVWAGHRAGGFGPLLSQPSAFAPGQPKSGGFAAFFFPSLTGIVGFWATLSLNIPDFTRYARSQGDQIAGQSIGLPLTMAFFSFIGVAVTSATTLIYGKTVWNPVDLLTKFDNPLILVGAMVALAVATLATNLAANVVSPANDFSNLAPRLISFRTGGAITGLIGLFIMPWKLMADPSGYVFTWLIGYGALLGPIGGIMIADYFWVRRRVLDVEGLYDPAGPYRYTGGYSLVAFAALVVAVLPNIPGFLVQVGAVRAAHVPGFLIGLYDYAWFVGFGVAFLLYGGLRLSSARKAERPAP